MIISTSKTKCYKACKRAYYFRYIQELEPVETAKPLQDGSSYHAMIESLYKTGEFDIDMENPKISAMATAYKKYIYPQFKVRCVEEWFEYKLDDKNTLVGRFDGIAEDGSVVEHKTTSADVDEEYEYNLRWDEQVLNYMLASGKNQIYYTVCKKPTIRQKQNETVEEFYERCVAWYDEDTEKKLRVLKVTRPQVEVSSQKEALIELCESMQFDEDRYYINELVNRGEKVFYRNTCHCTQYGRKCEFASICLDYNPRMEYIEFKKKEKSEQ